MKLQFNVCINIPSRIVNVDIGIAATYRKLLRQGNAAGNLNIDDRGYVQSDCDQGHREFIHKVWLPQVWLKKQTHRNDVEPKLLPNGARTKYSQEIGKSKSSWCPLRHDQRTRTLQPLKILLRMRYIIIALWPCRTVFPKVWFAYRRWYARGSKGHATWNKLLNIVPDELLYNWSWKTYANV